MPTTSPPIQRVFEHKRVWRLDQDVFERGARLLARALPRPDIVVGIARGGMPLARELAARFAVGVAELTARHNESDALYLPATGRVRVFDEPATVNRLSKGSRLLVVDDICGTGATLTTVASWLVERAEPASVRTAVLCRSEAARFTPDVWLWNTLDWVVFPWNEPPPEGAEPLSLPSAAHIGAWS